MTAFDPTIQIIINGSIWGDEIDVTTMSITGGRTSIGYQPEPMIANFDLIPSSGYPDYKLMDPVEITVTDPSTSNVVTLFYGFISDINFNYYAYAGGQGQRRYSITAQDPTASLPFATFNTSTNIVQGNAGEQIGQALSYWDYPVMSGSIINPRWTTSPTSSPTINDQSGTSYTLDLIAVTGTDMVGDFVRETADQVNGCLYYKAQNKYLYFDGLTRRLGRTAFSLGYNEIRPDINLTQSTGMIINKTLVTRAGTNASNSTASSISTYGRRQYIRDTRLHNLADAQTKAASILTSFSNVSGGAKVKKWRPSTISVDLHNPNLTDAKRSDLLNVFCGSPVDVTVPDPANTSYPGSMVLNCLIEGFTWTFGPKQLNLTAALFLTSDYPE